MQDRPEFNEDSTIWAAAEAVLTGRVGDWDVAMDETPPEQRSLMRELGLIAEVVAAHEERQCEPRGPGRTAAGGAAGDIWGPLVILEKIGAGAFGDVYRAREPRLDRQVALKFFRPHRLSLSQLTSDVIEEGRLLARVRHPNVVTVHGAKHLDGQFGIWMEFVEGSTLEEIVAEQGPLSATEAMAIGRDLCGALTALHEAGILHRDIKARNVMREESGRVVLMDLGISCEIDREIPIRQYGTPLYAAPEVLLENSSSRQGDIYSLGVLLYFLVSGRYPVTGATLADIHAAHEAGRIESLAAVRPDLPDGFLRVVEKALAVNRYERFTTAAELEQALADTMKVDGQGGHEPGAGADQISRLARSQTDDQQAQNHYLLGRHYWSLRAKGGLPRALECFRQAVARDQEFALAHLGIAQCLSLISYWQYMRPRDGFAQMRSAAERALAIDPDLGEAHGSIGCVCMCHDWDAVVAERAFERAVQLDPQSIFTRTWYALLLSSEGRHDDALAEVRARRELDPASLVIAIEAIVLSHAGRLEEALEIFRLGLETDPESLPHHNHMGLALLLAGELEDAETCLRRAVDLSKGEDAWSVGTLAELLAWLDRRDEAHELIAHLEALAQRRYVSFFCRMMPWIPLDRYDKWSPLLEKAIEERDPYLIWMRTLGDRVPGLMVPRYAERLRSAGLLD